MEGLVCNDCADYQRTIEAAPPTSRGEGPSIAATEALSDVAG
jgi:hypothetical protein